MSSRERQTRDEWNQVLDTAPATPRQRGSVMRECGRLGLTDRAECLAVCADLLDLSELRSSWDLTMGQAGQLFRVLAACSDRSELPAPRRPQPSPITVWALAFHAARRAWDALSGFGDGEP